MVMRGITIAYGVCVCCQINMEGVYKRKRIDYCVWCHCRQPVNGAENISNVLYAMSACVAFFYFYLCWLYFCMANNRNQA